MKKGRMPGLQELRHVRDICDVDVFGDGDLWTITLIDEAGCIIWENGRLEIGPTAKIIAIELQTPKRSEDVYIREATLKRIRERFSRLKGVSG